MKKEEIPAIFYLYLHSKLWNMLKGEIVSEKEIKKNLFQWKIPSNLRALIIREMELLGLVERKNRLFLKLTKPKFKEEELDIYYRRLGFY